MSEKQLEKPLATWIGLPPEALAALAAEGVRYEDSDDFLLSVDAYEHDLYVVDLEQRGVSGIDLVRLIRRRSSAGLVVLSAPPHASYVSALELGADAVVDREAPPERVRATMAAVLRRVAGIAPVASTPWKLKERQAVLFAPDGTAITLSPSDLALMRVFALANGHVVCRSELTRQLWGPTASDMDNALQAALYRLRKRVEQGGQRLWPAHAVAGVGYEFRAPLLLA
jgi:two-component system OmpR family response regulator